jgi:hypothetical protein
MGKSLSFVMPGKVKSTGCFWEWEMTQVNLNKRRDGKTSIKLTEHGDCLVRIRNPDAEPYDPTTQRARAWHVVSLMDGLTVKEAHDILRRLEPNIQGKVGRPLGWLVDAIDLGNVYLERPIAWDA